MQCCAVPSLPTISIPKLQPLPCRNLDFPYVIGSETCKTSFRKEKGDAIRIVDLRIAGGFRIAEKRWDRPLYRRLARVPQGSCRVGGLCRRRSAGSTGNGNHDKN